MTESIVLARRIFSLDDQLEFARFSGDRNPMHVDRVLARRTQAGAPVVHGIHLLLWAIDSFAAANPDRPSMRSLRVQFSNLVYVDEFAEVVQTQISPDAIRMNVCVNRVPMSQITVTFGAPQLEAIDYSSFSPERIPSLQTALDLDFEQMSSRAGRIAFLPLPTDVDAMFPAASQWLGNRRVAALAASTYLVGMVCPGLHSIFGELAVEACAETGHEDALAFCVTRTDPRFRLVLQKIAGGGLTGTVKSFARTPPVQQPAANSLSHLVTPAEFAGSVVLVVGGSRGLGELTAKLLAAGGAQVIITWQSGKDDAEKVCAEIRSAGGKCETMSYDASKPVEGQLSGLLDAPTHMYYYATPLIFRHQSDLFVRERLDQFLDIYVDGFWQLSRALCTRQPKLSVFYPSSVFVEERPRGMLEYAMAKSAAEVLCTEMNKALPPMHITVSRLPRLPTDQTAGISAAKTALPLEILLPVVREVQSWPR